MPKKAKNFCCQVLKLPVNLFTPTVPKPICFLPKTTRVG